MTSKVIDLEGLRRFKELLDAANAEKFAALTTAFEEQIQNHVASDEQIDSMLDEIFGTLSTTFEEQLQNQIQIASDEQINSMLDEIFG